jgi:hypothetical protein
MKSIIAVEILHRLLKAPVRTWLDFDPRKIPLAVVDQEDLLFVHYGEHAADRFSSEGSVSAAFSLPLQDTLAAVISSETCHDERALVCSAYLECFHVYQSKTFQSNGDLYFYEALELYPDFSPEYRALRQAETEVANDHRLTTWEKAQALSALAVERYALLARDPSFLDFERALERSAGVAVFVAQKARAKLFGQIPAFPAYSYAPARHDHLAAYVCWLLDELFPDGEWQIAVQKGVSPTEYLIRSCHTHLPAWMLWSAPKREKRGSGSLSN